jgi:hypothetical protein
VREVLGVVMEGREKQQIEVMAHLRKLLEEVPLELEKEGQHEEEVDTLELSESLVVDDFAFSQEKHLIENL